MNDPNVISQSPSVSALLNCYDDLSDTLADRARGVMLGLAVGNLLGIPVEGWRHDEIARKYPAGLAGIDAREPHRPMDDDLAQAVDLGEALLEGGDYVNSFADRLVKWAYENGRGIGLTTSRVIQRLGAGHSPPEAARIVYEADPIAPNGGVMRCAPVALCRIDRPELLVNDSAATCVVTHYSAVCQWSCIMINTVIAQLLRGLQPDLASLMAAMAADGAPDMLAIATDDGIPAEVFSCIASGEAMPSDASWLRKDQGLIGHTLIALQTGLWASVAPMGFEEALRQIVESGGDTDTNGAVAGSVLGARFGASAIPESWLACVPQRARIERLADQLIASDS